MQPLLSVVSHHIPLKVARDRFYWGHYWECETLGFVRRARPVLDSGYAVSTSRRKIRVIIIKTAVVLCQARQLALHKHSQSYLMCPYNTPGSRHQINLSHLPQLGKPRLRERACIGSEG